MNSCLVKMVTAPPVQAAPFISYLLLSKHGLALEYIKMKEQLAKVQTGECRERSLRTCLDFKGCLIRLGWHFQTLPEPCVTQERHSLPQERSRAQASSPVLAGLSAPVSLLWDSLCQQHPHSARVLVHRLVLSEGRGSFAFSLISACFQLAFFLFLPGLRVGTGEDTILLFYCHSAKAGHVCNPHIPSVSPCVIHFKHLHLQKLNTRFHAAPVASNTQNNALPQTFSSLIQDNQL